MIDIKLEHDPMTSGTIVKALIPAMDANNAYSIMSNVIQEICEAYARAWLKENDKEIKQKLKSLSSEALGDVVKELIIEKLTSETKE